MDVPRRLALGGPRGALGYTVAVRGAADPIEYRLLETLAVNAGRLCTHRFLLERVWGPGYGEQSQYLRVYMANLRKKLDDPAAPQLLLTEPGMGYRFVVPDPDGAPAEA